jgi:hypothetical protein
MKEDKAYIVCPDDNVIAQFIEGTLNVNDEDLVLRHLDHCEKCYEIVNTALKFEEEDGRHIHKCIPLDEFKDIPKYYAAGENEGDEEMNTIENKQSGRNTTCAIKVQQLVLKDLNVDISEELILQEALQEGWYVEGKGMLMEHVGKTLNKHGINTDRRINTDLQELVLAIKEGSKVIVAVDSGELWFCCREEQEQEKQEDLLEEIPDHVVLVENVQTVNKTIVSVSIKDPLLFEGTKKVDIDVFMNAWQDSDFFMIKTVD